MKFNSEPIRIYKRDGSPKNPHINIEENIRVIDNRAYLKEIPSAFDKVKISENLNDSVISYSEVSKKEYIKNATNFYVDYKEGIVHFHKDANDRNLKFEYVGIGVILYPASRIYVNGDSSTAVETLQQITEVAIDGLQGAKEAIEELGGAVEAEKERKLSENLRINAEADRIANENSRIANEDDRVSKESDRVTAENSRVSNEDTRQINETNRANTETQRNNRENARQTNEANRNNNETNRVNAENSRITNETNRINAENDRTTAESVRETNENNRIVKEAERVNNENSRVTAEIDRSDSESIRKANENNRIANEVVREDNENIRIQNEAQRQTVFEEAKEATEQLDNVLSGANSIIQNLSYKDEFSENANYKVYNIVLYKGSTYICIKDSVGNVPTDFTYFRPLAIKGADGVGGVNSVNGHSGNVELTALDVNAYSREQVDNKISDINTSIVNSIDDKIDNKMSAINDSIDNKIDKSEKGVADGIAKLNSQGKVVDASGNEVEGKVKSVNGKEGIVELIASDVNAYNIEQIDNKINDILSAISKKINSSEKGKANGVAMLNENGKVVNADGEEVSGKVTSVNGKIGDVVIDNVILQQDTEPEGIEEGRLWLDTSDDGGIYDDAVDKHKQEKVFDSETHGLRVDSEGLLEYFNTATNSWVTVSNGYFGDIPNASLDRNGLVKLTNVLGNSESLAITQKGLNDIVNSTKAIIDSKYEKPVNGIPKTDLDSSVQDSLNLANSALQSVTKNDIGLGNVDDTKDIDKPVSTATQNALNSKANLNSPSFSGTPTAPTPLASTNNNQIATTSFVQNLFAITDRTAILVYPSTTSPYQNGTYTFYNKFATQYDSLNEVSDYLITPKYTGYYALLGKFNIWTSKIQTWGRFNVGIEDTEGNMVSNNRWEQDQWVDTVTGHNVNDYTYNKIAYLESGKQYRISLFCVLNGWSGEINITAGSPYFILVRV